MQPLRSAPQKSTLAYAIWVPGRVPSNRRMPPQSPAKGGDEEEVNVIGSCAVPTATSVPTSALPTSIPMLPSKLSVTPGSMVRVALPLTSIYSEML